MPRKLLFVFLLTIGCIKLTAQTPAHKKSAFAVIDPMYSSNRLLPATHLKTGGAGWLYGPAELECWRLQLLREKTVTAQLKVGYPGTFHTPFNQGSFRLKLNSQEYSGKIRFRAVGEGTAYLNDQAVLRFSACDSIRTIILPKNKLIGELRFDISTFAEPPALLIEKGCCSTLNTAWEWKAETENWQPAFHFARNTLDVPPHRLESPEAILKPVDKSGETNGFSRRIHLRGFGYAE